MYTRAEWNGEYDNDIDKCSGPCDQEGHVGMAAPSAETLTDAVIDALFVALAKE
jgi:hypothetical protein